MWYENLEQIEFLKKLYTVVPDINKVTIFDFRISDSGKEVSISFVLKEIVDYFPPKWKANSFKYPVIKLDFFEVSNIELLINSDLEDMNLQIFKEYNQNIILKGTGKSKFKIISEIGIIQKIEGKK